MNGPGKHSLAGAAFSLNQNRSVIRFGGLACYFQHAAHRRILGHDAPKIILTFGGLDRIADPHAQ